MKLKTHSLAFAIATCGWVLFASGAGAEPLPWARDWKGIPPAYYFNTGDGSFWVYDREIERKEDRNVEFWLHGQHKVDPKVRYRTSLWHIRLDCLGGYVTNAYTTFSPSGSVVDDWDGIGSRSLIRPGTMYQSLETQLCRK